jgi:Ca2+-transporting ATPase
MRTVQDVQRLFQVTPDTGLSSDFVVNSRQQFGANRLTPLPREPLWKKFLAKFDEPIIKILLGAALLSMFVELFQGNPAAAGIALGIVAAAVVGVLVARHGELIPSLLFVSALALFFVGLAVPPHHPSIEGLAVMIAVVLATGVAFLSEYKSDREFEVLNAQKDSIHVKTLRGGTIHLLTMEEIVVGDVVSLETGDEIPGDGRLLKANELHVDQSLMTGESEPMKKSVRPADDAADGPEQPGCLYRGTQVVDGSGLLLITEIGDATYLGQIARRLSAEDDEEEETATAENEEKRVKRKLTISKEPTPLQLKLTNLANLISRVGYLAAGLIFLALLGRGFLIGELSPAQDGGWFKVAGNLLSYFVYMVIIIVVAVPEGLPMSVTVSLALAMRKMTRANSLVRQLVACETIGSATVICSDKTGTLTQNKMQVERVFFDGAAHDRVFKEEWHRRPAGAATGGTPVPPHLPCAPVEWIALNAAVNSTANLEEKNGATITVGNTTEGALLHWLRDAKLDYQPLRDAHPVLYQINFSSERKRMTSIVRDGDRLVALVKGAPEMLLERSTHYLSTDGAAREWTPDAKRAVVDALRDAAGRAMRTLAFGHAVLPPGTPETEEGLHDRRDTLENGLAFTGFVAIRDPLRADVPSAIAECRSAGVEVKMITGDNVETARAIAADIGLIDSRDAAIDTEDAVVMTSPVFNERFAQLKELRARGDAASADALRKRLTSFRVLARARPLDKYKMVELLQEEQQVVAVTGDGTNDAPALKKADVGLAMGIAGTEVAKEASKIVLLDDAFSTIVKAVHWGRSLYENIQRFIQFQLTINVSALVIAFLGPFLGVKPPFTVLQLLWINVIMDTFASIALCSEPPRDSVMQVPPKRKDENILTPAMVRTIFATAAFFVVVMLGLLLGMEYGGWFATGSGANPDNWEFAPLKVRQVSIFFTVYIFFQVWNQLNCRSLVPSESGFRHLFANGAFLAIAGTVAVVQVLIVSVPWVGAIFKVEPLGWLDWLLILIGTASVLLFAEVARRVRVAMSAKR